MAVQAQRQATGDIRNSVTQLTGFDLSVISPASFEIPIPFQDARVGECPAQQVAFVGNSAMECMQRLPQHVASASPIPGLTLPNFAVFQAPSNIPVPDLDVAMGGSRKRRKEPLDGGRSGHLYQYPMQKSQPQLGVDLNQALGCAATNSVAPHNVSTGLRLAFDDERSTVTSSRPDSSSSVSLALKDEISAQFSQHQEEVNQLIATQAEQMKQVLEDRTRRQSKALLAAVEGGLARRLHEKEVEMERLNRQNIELEETVKQLSMESQMWQSKAKNNEAMVAILRMNLQQAVLSHQHQSREHQSRLEGCGDSEVDDTASVYIDDNLCARQSRAMAGMMKAAQLSHSLGLMKAMKGSEVGLVRACQRCKAKEASVVLLPCLHLCLCVGCKEECNKCPVCSMLKSASVEVYLS